MTDKKLELVTVLGLLWVDGLLGLDLAGVDGALTICLDLVGVGGLPTGGRLLVGVAGWLMLFLWCGGVYHPYL